jgi:four helix bundle protein
MSKPTKDEIHRKAHELTLDVYRAIQVDPKHEEFDLAQELRHAAFSVSMVLSPEVRRDDAIDAARGSSARLECLLIIAQDLHYFSGADLEGFVARISEINADLHKLQSGLRGSGS